MIVPQAKPKGRIMRVHSLLSIEALLVSSDLYLNHYHIAKANAVFFKPLARLIL